MTGATITSAFPRTRRRPLRRVVSGTTIRASVVNRWIEAINEATEAKR
jgi:hypothetical protein